MGEINPLKIGVGVGAMLIGAYIALGSAGTFIEVIIGIAISAFGVSLIASSQK